MINIVGGKDPDELIQKDPSAWEKAVAKPQYALDWLIERYQKNLDLSSAQGKRQFSDIVMKTIGQLTDPVEQDHYVNFVADLLKVAPQSLRTKLGTKNKAILKQHKQVATPEPNDKIAADRRKIQDHFLALTLLVPELRDYVGPIAPEMVGSENAQQLLAYLHEEVGQQTVDLKTPKLRRLTEYVNILVLQFEQLYKGLEPLELRYEAARLQARLIEQYVKTQKQSLAEQLRRADDSDTDTLLGKAKELDSLLKRHQGE